RVLAAIVPGVAGVAVVALRVAGAESLAERSPVEVAVSVVAVIAVVGVAPFAVAVVLERTAPAPVFFSSADAVAKSVVVRATLDSASDAIPVPTNDTIPLLPGSRARRRPARPPPEQGSGHARARA